MAAPLSAVLCSNKQLTWPAIRSISLTDMANSRIHRFISEVAPPRFATVMRQRTWIMLETICEEDRDGSYTVDT
ncbi:hypothetical protein V6N13_023631 [Hibiscus sabdariffa]